MATFAVIFASLSTILCAVLGYIQVRQSAENRRLRKVAARALRDCIAFHLVEDIMCGWSADNDAILNGRTPVAIQRFFRAMVRAHGHDSPSGEATPQRLTEELERLQ